MQEQVSNLSQTAKEVNPLLKMTYQELRKAIEERGEIYDEMTEQYGNLESVEEALGQENLVKLANKIIKGQGSQEEKINFGLLLTQAKSKVTQSSTLTERQITIITNFIRKLRAIVLKTEVGVE
ncbi:MAG: hypothetical protein ABID64_02290 [Nitrospirota bacterium]